MRIFSVLFSYLFVLLVLRMFDAPMWAAIAVAFLQVGIVSICWEIYELRKAVKSELNGTSDG
jgi:hypothetical protein